MPATTGVEHTFYGKRTYSIAREHILQTHYRHTFTFLPAMRGVPSAFLQPSKAIGPWQSAPTTYVCLLRCVYLLRINHYRMCSLLCSPTRRSVRGNPRLPPTRCVSLLRISHYRMRSLHLLDVCVYRVFTTIECVLFERVCCLCTATLLVM